MKKFIALLTIMVVLAAAPASAGQFEVGFTWNQDNVEDKTFNGWRLYYSETSGGEYKWAADIPFDGTVLDEYAFELPTTGLPKDIPLYFVLVARDIYAQESGYSNEVETTVPGGIPPAPPVAPNTLKCFIRIAPTPTAP